MAWTLKKRDMMMFRGAGLLSGQPRWLFCKVRIKLLTLPVLYGVQSTEDKNRDTPMVRDSALCTGAAVQSRIYSTSHC